MHRILITIRRRYTSRRSAIFSSEYLPSRTICSKHLLQVLNSVFLAFLSLPHSIFFYLIRFHFFPFFFLPCFDFLKKYSRLSWFLYFFALQARDSAYFHRETRQYLWKQFILLHITHLRSKRWNSLRVPSFRFEIWIQITATTFKHIYGPICLPFKG